MLRADQKGGNFTYYHPIQDMTLLAFTGLFIAFPPMFQSMFILLIKQLFSKILSPKYHARASKEIRSRRTYKSLVNIQTSRVNKRMDSVSWGHKMHSFAA